MKNEALALAVPAGIVGAMYFLAKKSLSSPISARINSAVINGGTVALSSCGNVTKNNGDTFTLSIDYTYSLPDEKILAFAVNASPTAEMLAPITTITKSGTGSDTINISSFPISLSSGTYNIIIKLLMSDIGGSTGTLMDTYTCAGALTIGTTHLVADIVDALIT